MNTVKKLEIENLPQDFSPQTLPEILRLAKKISGETAFVYEKQKKPFFMETDRLIIRRFTPEDGEAVLALSLDRRHSSMKDFDHQWPADLEGCKGAAAYFAGSDSCFAVTLKPSMKLIGFLSFNSVDGDNMLDLGHVWHTACQNDDLDTEALSLMTQYAFEEMGVSGVTAENPLECAEQIAPLKSIGMQVIQTQPHASFVSDEKGNPIQFTGCKMEITREQWEKRNPGSYSPRNKPEILRMAEAVQKDTEALPPSVRISFSGAVDPDGPPMTGHTRAFSAAVMSLTVLMGLPHDTRTGQERSEHYRIDFDYNRNLLLSGEGFLFWSDVWQFITAALPQAPEGSPEDTWESFDEQPHTAQPLLDCLEGAGIEAEFYSNDPMEGISGGYEAGEGLKSAVMRNLSEGFPVLLFSGEPGDRIILATGYQKGGEVLLGWVFSAGHARQNMTFSPKKTKRLTNWDENILALLLVRSKPMPPEDRRYLTVRALERGAALLRSDKKLEGFANTFGGTAEVHVHPEIWDLAERRSFLAYELKETAKLLKTDALNDAMDACWNIHDAVWRIDALSKSKKGLSALKSAAVQKKIAEILMYCRRQDLRMADSITRFLSSGLQPQGLSPEEYSPKNKPEILTMMEKTSQNESFVERVHDRCTIVDRAETHLIGIKVPISFESRGYQDDPFSMNDYFVAKKYLSDGTVSFLADTLGVSLGKTEIVSTRFDMHGDGNYQVIVGFRMDSVDHLPAFLPEHTAVLTLPACRYAKMDINEQNRADRTGYAERMHADEYFISEFRATTDYIYNMAGYPMNTWDETGDILTKYEPIRKPADENDRFGTFEARPVLLPPWKIACCIRPHGDEEGDCISDYFDMASAVSKTGATRYNEGDFYGFPVDRENSYVSCFNARVSSFDGLPKGVEQVTLPGGCYVHVTQMEFNGDNPSMPYDMAFHHMDRLYFNDHPEYEFDQGRKVIARFRQANCASVFVPVKRK